MHSIVWDGNTYPFTNFNRCIVIYRYYLSMLGLKSNHVIKKEALDDGYDIILHAYVY